MSTLHWGLLGTARINRAVIPAIREARRSVLDVVASRDLARAQAYAGEWQIPRAVGSYEALLADPSVNAIYVPLPNHLHAEWAIAAARAGKHVLCEKPMALVPEDVDRLQQAATNAGVVIAEAFMYRHHAQTRQVQALVDEGMLGDVRLIHGSFSFMLARDTDVRLQPAYGGGSLWDVGCYPVSYARLLMRSEPESVIGVAERGPMGVDLTFAGLMRFSGGRLATFDCGFQSAFRASMEIVGSAAALEIPSPFKPGAHEQLHVVREGVRTTLTVDVEDEPLYVGEVEDMERAALDGAPQAVTMADSRGNVAAIQALYASAVDGRPVALRR
jgi:predicted dehydrogenase